MKTIESLHAREILDSRGNPTVEVTLVLQGGSEGTASVPSGASTGIHESHELRDGDMTRYEGLGVRTAVRNVEEIIGQAIVGSSFDQKSLDEEMIALDGTAQKSHLGANAILGVSLAFAKAYAQDEGLELYEYFAELAGNTEYEMPQPAFNIINGGKHADSGLDIQEFMIVPHAFDAFHEKVRVASEIIHTLKDILSEKGYAVSVGDEGGFAPELSSNEEAFELLTQAIIEAGYSLKQVSFAIDAAATSFYKDGAYHIHRDGSENSFSRQELLVWYQTLIDSYPIISLEDPFAEDDWEGFTEIYAKMGDRIQIVGDDLTVTNIQRIEMAAEKHAINAVLIKLNQIGTLSETIDAVQYTKSLGWAPFISHRSGETTDTCIADLSVGLSCPYIKAGSLTRGERVVKYDRLMEIEDALRG